MGWGSASRDGMRERIKRWDEGGVKRQSVKASSVVAVRREIVSTLLIWREDQDARGSPARRSRISAAGKKFVGESVSASVGGRWTPWGSRRSRDYPAIASSLCRAVMSLPAMLDESFWAHDQLLVWFFAKEFFIMTPFLIYSSGFTRDSRIGILVNFQVGVIVHNHSWIKKTTWLWIRAHFLAINPWRNGSAMKNHVCDLWFVW